MKEPANWQRFISGMTWMGPGRGYKFNLQSNTSLNWTSLAKLDGCSPKELIWLNFQTYDPKEINWYLYHFVGCRYSNDGLVNLSFAWSRPGIIYTHHNLWSMRAPSIHEFTVSKNTD